MMLPCMSLKSWIISLDEKFISRDIARNFNIDDGTSTMATTTNQLTTHSITVDNQ
jgi:hypothetical protein